jgi:hypothetical protein
MWARYTWNAGASLALVTKDLAMLASGSAVASLSSSCNKGASTIYGGASGWSAHDTANGVISAVCADGSAKYLRIISSPTAGSVRVYAPESHSVGTAPAVVAGVDFALAVAAAGSLTIYATGGNFALAHESKAFCAAFEIARGSPLLAGYPLHGVFIGAASAYATRIKNPLAVGDLSLTVVNLYSPQGNTVSAVRDKFEWAYAPVLPAVVLCASAYLGAAVGLWRTGNGIGATHDTLTDGAGNVYVVLRSGAEGFLIRRA